MNQSRAFRALVRLSEHAEPSNFSLHRVENSNFASFTPATSIWQQHSHFAFCHSTPTQVRPIAIFSIVLEKDSCITSVSLVIVSFKKVHKQSVFFLYCLLIAIVRFFLHYSPRNNKQNGQRRRRKASRCGYK